MEWIQAALDASEESEEIEDNETFDGANDIPEKFDEKKFKENTDLLKFGREHLQRIKNNKIYNNPSNHSRNDNKQSSVHISQEIFTLQTTRQIKRPGVDIDFKKDYIKSEKEPPKPPQINDTALQVDQTFNDNLLKHAPKGKEWKGYEKCTAHIYGENISGNNTMPTCQNLGHFKEEFRTINFNIPAQTFTTSDGDVLQSNQIRRTQKRKHQV
ncbi:hypothetical protein BmR1_04g09391, partial [Babesia microti strain RI]